MTPGPDDELRLAVREALAEVAARPGEGAPSREALRRFGEAGVIRACLVPESERGGRTLPLDLRAFEVVIQELVGAGDPGLALSLGLHLAMFVPFVVRFGAGLPEVVAGTLDGELLGALAMTDGDGPGSDPLGMGTRIESVGDGVVITGRKTYVTNVPGADAVVVFAARPDVAPFARLSAVLVPTAHPGVREQSRPMGVLRSAAVGDLELDHVALGPEHVLGRTGRGLQHFVEHIGVERLMGGIWAVAAGRAHLARARAAAGIRLLGDDPLWSNAVVRQRLAAAAVRVELLAAAVDQALDQGQTDGRVDAYAAAVVKAAAAGTVEEVVGTCLQLQGAAGLEEGSPLLAALADARSFGVAGGTTETMLELVADNLADRMGGPPG